MAPSCQISGKHWRKINFSIHNIEEKQHFYSHDQKMGSIRKKRCCALQPLSVNSQVSLNAMKHNIYANICPVGSNLLVAESKPKRMPFKNTNWDGIANVRWWSESERQSSRIFGPNRGYVFWTFFEREIWRVTKNIFFPVFRAGFILVNGSLKNVCKFFAKKWKFEEMGIWGLILCTRSQNGIPFLRERTVVSSDVEIKK